MFKNAKLTYNHWSLAGFFSIFIFCLLLTEQVFIASTVTGYTKADVSVSESGGARLRIPITIATGTQMVPQIAITYSSQNSNGLLGYGFELEGIYSITRVPATLSEDNFAGGINFDQNDRFALNGQRIVSVKGNDGADSTEYRTEQNSFSRIYSYGQSGSGPAKFIVQTKDGLIMEYGYTLDSRIEAKGKASVLSWFLNKASDTKGNYFTYSYIKDTTTGEFYPDKILYTGNMNTGLLPYNRIQFSYESIRKDTVTGFYSASSYKFTKRLSKIEVFEEDGSLYRQYHLSYQSIGLRNASHLKSISECGNNGDCFEPTFFNWIDENISGSQSLLTSSTPFSGDINIVDLNADGRQDILLTKKSSISSTLLQGSTLGFTPAINQITPDYEKFRSFDYVDLNRDGLPDFIGFSKLIGTSWKVEVRINKNGSFSEPVVWYEAFAGWPTVLPQKWFIDVDADGYMDIVFAPDLGADIRLLKNIDGKSFKYNNRFGNLPFNQISATSITKPMDLNGDGLTDFIHWDGDSSWFAIYNTGQNLIKGWVVVNQSIASNKNIYTFDLNNDGLTDILSGPSKNGDWKAIINDGKDFLDKGVILKGSYGNFAESKQVYTQDLNGDNFTDILLGPDSSGKFYYLLNDGSKLIDKGVWLNTSLGNYADKDSLTHVLDFNGDGLLDICYGPDALGNWQGLVNKSNKDYPHLLQSVVTGNGTKTEFEYDKLTNPNIYSKESTVEGNTMNFVAPVYVVSAVKTDNGIGGQNKIDYKYENAKLELNGRAFRGFEKMIQIDSLHQTRNITFFNRDEKYTSTKVIKTENRLLDGRLLYVAENEDALKTGTPSTVRWSYIKKTSEKWYELDGKLTKAKQTTYDYDDFGNPTTIVESYDTNYIVEIKNIYFNDTLNWRLGRLIKSAANKTLKGKPSITKTAAFEYDSKSGLLISETTQPESLAQWVKKIYTLDDYGNQIKITTKGADIEDIIEESAYDTKGRFMISKTSPLGHLTKYMYKKGFLESTIDPNGLTERVVRDGFGRPIEVTYPDGKHTYTTYTNCNTLPDCFPFSYYVMKVVTEGGETKATYFDKLDREVAKTETIGFNANLLITQTTYNEKGEVLTKTEPYVQNTTPLTHKFEYDIISRQIKEIAPDNRISSVIYNGLTNSATNPENQTATHTVNAVGWLIISKDNQQNILTYEYDSDGNIIKVTDPVGNRTLMSYDIRGFKTSMTDPDFKTITYKYDCLGRIKSQTYADGRTITMEYDKLSRKIRQIEPERTLEWVYDQGNKGIGKLSTTKINGVVSKSLSYDNIGRPITQKEFIEGEEFTTTYAYDEYSRISTLTYPITGFNLKYTYDNYGHLQEILRGDNNKSVWKLDSLEKHGFVQNFTLGNGLKTKLQYNANTGYLEAIQTGDGVRPANVQYLAYAYTPIGNMTQRKDLNRNLTENFEYDNLTRITKAQVTGQNALTMAYDKIGNITQKSDIGKYTYGGNNVGPHMVTGIDNEGISSCSSVFQGQVGYNSFNYPTRVIDGRDTINISYDERRKKQTQRFVKNGTLMWKKLYISDMMEKVITSTETKYIHYIKVQNDIIATYETGGITPPQFRYLHKDHLGSLNAITTETGGVIESFSYDVWGKARDSETWKPILSVVPPPPFQRGFTFHEMLGIENLIFMESRLYDPSLARFLSPDPFIPDPEYSQAYNRASYVFNNPLSYTDPSGFLPKWAKKALKIARKVVKVVATVAVAVVAAAALPAVLVATGVASAASVASGTVLGTIVSGAGAGFGSSFAGSLLNGGNITDALKAGLKGAAIGVVSAGLSFGVGETFGHITTAENVIPKMITHGAVQGGLSVAQGGSFASGFAAGAFSSGASVITNNISSDVGKIAASAIVGGTASKLAGGSFANGAVSGAFVEMFNGQGRNMDNEFNKMLEDNSKKALDESSNDWFGLKPSWYYMIEKFRTGGEFDIKNNSFKDIGNETFYNGELMRRDDYGNYQYGYIGTQLGFSKLTLLRSAGAYQLWSNGFAMPKGNWDTRFDNPGDQEMIKKGIYQARQK